MDYQPAFEERKTTPHGERIGRAAMLVVSTAFLSVCFYLILHTWNQCRLARIARDWPTTNARITSSIGYRTPLSIFYAKIDMTYQYRVDDEVYKSKRLCYGRYRYWDPIPKDPLGVSMETPSPPGTTLPVHYNPSNPQEAVLLTDVNVTSTLRPTLFIVCLGFAGLFLAPGSGLGRPALMWMRLWDRPL